jgi:hypothetical protein
MNDEIITVFKDGPLIWPKLKSRLIYFKKELFGIMLIKDPIKIIETAK